MPNDDKWLRPCKFCGCSYGEHSSEDKGKCFGINMEGCSYGCQHWDYDGFERWVREAMEVGQSG